MFVNLVIKSGYSFLRSTLHIEDILKKARDEGWSYLGICDESALFSTATFYDECLKNEIKPIIGMEIRLKEDNSLGYPFILLAKDITGYKNLCYLTSLVSKGDLKEELEYSQLEKHSQGLVAILPISRGYYRHVKDDDIDNYLGRFKTLFTDFYLGLERYEASDDALLDRARKHEYKKVAISEVRCLKTEDKEYLDVLEAIDLGISVDKLENKNTKPVYFRPLKELKLYFKDEELEESNNIANMCQFDIHKLQGSLITYPLKKGVNADDYLSALCQKGLEKRLNKRILKNYQERLDYELSVIKKMGFTNYFLVVYDYVKFAKQNDILVGPGRGSGAGSLVAYVLGITSVDPIRNNLLFERFLNPERITMPDIDIDFIDTRRDEVIAYLINKYGLDHTAHVIAFQTFGAKQALRDAAKAIGVPLYEVDNFAKKIPLAMYYDDLETIVNNSPSFKALINSSPRNIHIYEIARHLEGLPRQTTMHAAGMVISDTTLCEVSPVYQPTEGVITTQFDMNHLEEFGLLKMDLLGLKNLGTIGECLDNIAKTKGKVDLSKINLSDPNIYEQISSTKTAGIFQLESQGMRRAIRIIRPNCFEDIVALLALFRPGPMDSLQLFADRKHGKVKVDYPAKALEDILRPTYGTIIYQEQIMQILVKMAGFSLGEADIVRRAISKKKSEQLLEIEERFIKGCLEKGYDLKTSQNVYQLILKFAGYGFNRAHSVSYSLISVEMAYLKYYYPREFYIAVLNSYTSETKFNEYISEIKERMIEILPPSINKSQEIFALEDGKIRYSLRNLKGLTPGAIKEILNMRLEGEFKDFSDLLLRAKAHNLASKFIQVLIYSGALDEFGLNRTTLDKNLDTYQQYVDIVSSTIDGQTTFDTSLVEKPKMIEYPSNMLIEAEKEKEILGIYLTTYPLKEDRKKLKDAGFETIEELKRRDGSGKCVVYILSIRLIRTKKNESMAHLKVEDESGSVTLTIFPKEYREYETLLKKGNYLQIRANVDVKNEQISFILQGAKIYHLREEMQ